MSPRRADTLALWVVVGVFAVSRLAAWAGGVRFDASNLTWYWQFLDVELLRHDLGRSLWYLHSQPPLFNLLLGTAMKLAPESSDVVLAILFRAGGLALAVCSYGALSVLGVRPWLAATTVSLLVVGPAFLLYENYLLYTFPTTVLLGVSIYSLVRCVRARSFGWAMAFAVAIALVCLTRSLFHPSWLVAVLLLLGWRMRSTFSARRWLLAASPALLLVGVFLGKNLLLFGAPSGSSWLGMNLFEVAAARVSDDELEALYEAGKLSELSMLAVEEGRSFLPIDRYPESLRRGLDTGVPALDLNAKNAHHPVTGARVPNFNHHSIPEVSRAFLAEALRLIAQRPASYARAVAGNLATFVFPADSFLSPTWSKNAERLAGYSRFYNLLFRGSLPRNEWEADAPFWTRLRGKSLLFVVLIPAALAFGTHLARGRRSTDDAYVAAFIFIAFTILYVAVVSNTLNFGEGESPRMFFLVEPLVFLLLGVCLEDLLNRGTETRTAALDDEVLANS